jgi:hypothetical protein
MRRLALVSIVLLILLYSCGGEAEPVEVTGSSGQLTEEIPGELTGEPLGTGESWSTMRGTVYRGVFNDLTDDRVNGDFEHVMDIDLTVDGDRTTGEIRVTNMTITNDGGTWEGTGQGTTTWTTTEPGHFHNIDYTLVGTGDYEGLQFTYHTEGIDYPWELTGTIEPVES